VITAVGLEATQIVREVGWTSERMLFRYTKHLQAQRGARAVPVSRPRLGTGNGIDGHRDPAISFGDDFRIARKRVVVHQIGGEPQRM
jgi:hypothetical protein